MPKSTDTCNKFLALLYNATAWTKVADNASSTPYTSIYVSLHTAPLTAATNQQTENESAYTDYGRQGVARTTGGWNVPSSGATSNVAAIEFHICGVTGSTVTYVATGSDATLTGNVFHYGALNSSLAITNGITPRFAIGQLTITET